MIVKNYFNNMNKPHEARENDLNRINNGTHFDDRNIMKDIITTEEIKACVKTLKNGKAEGDDEIPNEFLKNGGKEILESLNIILNTVKDTEYIPNMWKRSYTKLLHKGGDDTDLDNYRGIAVTSNVGKLFSKIIGRKTRTGYRK